MIRRTVLALVCLGGCALPPSETLEHRRSEMWVGDAIRQASLNNAIITQRTLYSYHFVAGSRQLNELGERDLGILAKHYDKYGGTLNLSQGSTPAPLYGERLEEVRTALVDAGLSADQVEITNGVPGGSGISSQRLISIQTDPSEVQTLSITGPEGN